MLLFLTSHSKLFDSKAKIMRKLIWIILVLFSASLPAQVKWEDHWKPFSTEEYLFTTGLMAGSLLILDIEKPTTTRWVGGVFLDGPIRDLLKVNSLRGRESARKVGDTLALTVLAYPFFVDAIADVWLSKGDPWVASQISLISSQSLFLSAFITLGVKHLISRERPFQQECGNDPNYDGKCSQGESRLSFFSGHASLSFTAAGLVCAHHENFDLWGGMTPCYVAIGMATGATVSRAMADKHYASDLVIGAMVGWFSGYTLTKWLHYREKKSKGPEGVYFMPSIGKDSLEVNVSWVF